MSISASVFRAAIVFFGFSSSAAIAEQSIDLNLNDDSARLLYSQDVSASENTRFVGDGSLLYTRDDDSDGVAFLAAGGFKAIGDAGAAPHKLMMSVGGRLYWLHAESDVSEDVDGLSVGVGGEFRFNFAQVDRLVFAGHAYFSPDILSFADVEQLLDYALRVEYQVLRPAAIYVGYRQVKVKTDGGPNATLDSGAHIGLRIQF